MSLEELIRLFIERFRAQGQGVGVIEQQTTPGYMEYTPVVPYPDVSRPRGAVFSPFGREAAGEAADARPVPPAAPAPSTQIDTFMRHKERARRSRERVQSGRSRFFSSGRAAPSGQDAYGQRTADAINDW